MESDTILTAEDDSNQWRSTSLVPIQVRHSAPNLPRTAHLSLTFDDREFVKTEDNGPKNHNIMYQLLSVVYSKLLIILGLVLPVSQVLSLKIPDVYYDAFYVFLYGGSLLFIVAVNVIYFKKKTVNKVCRNTRNLDGNASSTAPRISNKNENFVSYGSFFLRIGACAFGIASMIYAGLEIGEYFLSDKPCLPWLPLVRSFLKIIFILLQLQFLFLADNKLSAFKSNIIVHFCLGHVLATNVGEWLYVVIEETKHEIHHIDQKVNNLTSIFTLRNNCSPYDQGVLIKGAASYLFPCSVEYNLICAMTLAEIMKGTMIEMRRKIFESQKFTPLEHQSKKTSWNRSSVDCTHSEKGLVLGTISNVYCFISLFVYFSLKEKLPDSANLALTICETYLYVASIIAITVVWIQMRNLPYSSHRFTDEGTLRRGLDLSLLFQAQTGVLIYFGFSIIATAVSDTDCLTVEFLAVSQTLVQTLFIADCWWKRCKTQRDKEIKPGRQLLVFLRGTNISLWVVSVLIRNRADFKPYQMEFYGTLPWVMITHVSMPLAIFYRFHSTVCLYEIWRTCYEDVNSLLHETIVF